MGRKRTAPENSNTAEMETEVAPSMEAPTEAPAPAPEPVAPAGDVFNVFDGPVADVRRERPEAPSPEVVDGTEAPPPRRRKGRKGKAAAPELPPEQVAGMARQQAEGLVRTGEAFMLIFLRRQLVQAGAEPGELGTYLEAHKFQPEEVQMLVDPLAELLAQEGVELPPEVRLGIAAVAVTLPRMMLVHEQKRMVGARTVVGERQDAVQDGDAVESVAAVS